MDRLNKSLIACVLFMSSYYGFSQQYPVQVTTTLAPPYSLYLSDYTAIGSNNLQVLVNLLELDRPNLQIKFRITIEGAGITLRTSPAFMPRPLNIQGGVPELFTGADLTSYFNPDHLDFTGITRAAFKRSGQLPEGFYTFTLEVLEYNRNVRISNQSISYAWIVLNDPPLLNTPFNGDKLIATDPQNIMFSWTPRHMASPNAAFSTEYEFRLVEMYPGQTNPDIAIRSSNSIYTTTTNLTSLNYGIIEPTLIPGKRYAFRVRAYDTSGRDLFKNDGFSETYVFQYGDACGSFEGIAARTLDPQRARISWESEQHHTGGVINYRKKGKEEWFTQDVNGSYGIVAQLAGQTTYEYQLTPQCGTILGEKSPMMTFTTPEVDKSGFVCGAPIPEFNGSDIPLMKPLLPLDVIQVGDWTVNLLNVSANGDGTYGGAGYAAVPNFNLANVRVVFDRILVNEDYQVVAGDIKTVYSEDSRFVLDIKKKEEELEVVEVPGDDSNPDPTENFVTDILTVNIEGDIGEVIFSGELLEIYDEAGNLIEDADLDLPPEGEELTIMDSNGDTWVVDSEGGVREVQGDESSTPESSEVDVIVHFKATEKSSYGFDAFDPNIPQLKHFYQNVLTINDEEYVPAWKSVPVGMPDQVIAMTGENELPENMKFRSSTIDLEPMAGRQDNEKHLSVIGKAHGDIDVIEAYQKIEDEENVAGRVNVVSYEKIYKTLEIVPVNGATIGDINAIGDRINKIFQQAAVEWKVEAAEPFMVDPKLLENFDEGESGMLASFPDKMQQFNRVFKRSRPVDKETYYIFVINEGSASLSGFMPFKRQFGYVFTKNTTYTNKTIAHELAHGAFRLRHTFSSAYGIPQRSTDNLMDYNGDLDKLKKFQWDLIHDPENLVGWFEDDEEASAKEKKVYDFGSSLNITSNSKLIGPKSIKLTYKINKWEKLIESLKLTSGNLKDYEILLFVTHGKEVVYYFTKDLTTSGDVDWHGLVFNEKNQPNSQNQDEFQLHLGIVPIDKFKLVKDDNLEFSLGAYPLSSILKSGSKSLTFTELVPNIDFEIEKAWENWNEVSDEVRKIAGNYVVYRSFERRIRNQKNGIGEIFTNIENPLQYLFDNSEEITFLGNKIRVHWTFAKKLMKIEELLGDTFTNELSNTYKGKIGGWSIRNQVNSTSISLHSYGTVVDIYPKKNLFLNKNRYSDYKGDGEVIKLIKFASGINLLDKADKSISKIIDANNVFKNKMHETSFDDIKTAYSKITEYYNEDSNYVLSDLLTVNPVKDLVVLKTYVEIGEFSYVPLFYKKIKALNDLLNSNLNEIKSLEMVIFDDVARSEMNNLGDIVESIRAALISIENDQSSEHISDLFERIDLNQYNMPNISNLLRALNEFFSDLEELGYINPLDYFSELEKWQTNRFKNELLRDGFCELDQYTINAFLAQEDIQWGGIWNSSTRVDYMHFEIKSSELSKYLSQIKPSTP